MSLLFGIFVDLVPVIRQDRSADLRDSFPGASYVHIVMAPLAHGYSDGDEDSDRLAVSQHRAILVRNFLQSHFDLDSSKVGAVALENRPPEGSVHTSWTGVVIVLLKVKP